MNFFENKKLVDSALASHKKLKKYIANNSSVIATRVLYFSLKGETEKNELVIKLYAPIQISTSTFATAGLNGPFACYLEFSRLCNGHLFYGYDEFQAIGFASDIDPILKTLGDRCNLYFDDSIECEFYFDNACNRW